MNTFRTFGETQAALVIPEDVILAAWPDMRAACANHDGKHETRDTAGHDEALMRAVRTLGQLYPSAGGFRAALAAFPLGLPESIDRTILFHFAAKWDRHERMLRDVETQQTSINQRFGEIQIVAGKGRIKRELTPDELERFHRRKQQRKATRK